MSTTADLLRQFARDVAKTGKACTDAIAARALEAMSLDLMEKAAQLDRILAIPPAAEE
jgi:hypothetical protein